MFLHYDQLRQEGGHRVHKGNHFQKSLLSLKPDWRDARIYQTEHS